MRSGTGAFWVSQVFAGQLETTCNNRPQNPPKRGVPPSQGNPSAGSGYTIGNLTTCDRKYPIFQGSARAGKAGSRLAKKPKDGLFWSTKQVLRLARTDPKMNQI